MEEDIYQNSERQPGINREKPNKKDIYQELKSDFDNNKSNKRNKFLIYILPIAIILCLYLFLHSDNKKVHEVSKAIEQVQVDWETVEVSNVKVINIPQEVYDSMEIDPNIPQEIYNQVNIDRSREQYLIWDKKHILLITWDGCPYARKFHKELDNIFDKTPHFIRYYTKDIKETWQYIEFSCINEYCASIRLFENCWEWICIINPMAKEIIVDNSQNYKQIFPLLEWYEARNNESLIQ